MIFPIVSHAYFLNFPKQKEPKLRVRDGKIYFPRQAVSFHFDPLSMESYYFRSGDTFAVGNVRTRPCSTSDPLNSYFSLTELEIFRAFSPLSLSLSRYETFDLFRRPFFLILKLSDAWGFLLELPLLNGSDLFFIFYFFSNKMLSY